LRTVVYPGVLEITSDNPTPAGYTWSLLLFIIPIAALSGWFARRPDLRLARKSFWRTIAVLAPVGFVLDLLGLFREALREVYIPRIQRGNAAFAVLPQNGPAFFLRFRVAQRLH
jgi:hypothetical protein